MNFINDGKNTILVMTPSTFIFIRDIENSKFR